MHSPPTRISAHALPASQFDMICAQNCAVTMRRDEMRHALPFRRSRLLLVLLALSLSLLVLAAIQLGWIEIHYHSLRRLSVTWRGP